VGIELRPPLKWSVSNHFIIDLNIPMWLEQLGQYVSTTGCGLATCCPTTVNHPL
jgi:hypothetical protein